MEEQGFVGCLETSPVHKRFKLGSPSREIPVTAQQITKSACCGVPSTYHHYGPTGGSKNEKSFKDQEAGLSVKLAVCKKAGKDKAETAHCKVDQFRFTDDVEIFLPSSKYSVSSSNKQANKPNYLDNEGSSRVQDLQSDSDADLGLLPAIQPQDGITSLSGKVCSLGSVTNREGQVDVKVTNSCHLKNDSNQDTTSRGDCKPCLLDYKDSDQETTSRGDCKSSCLLDYCDTHLPIAQQDLPFEDASAAESIMKKQCNFPSAQVVKLKDLITDQCREELSHLDSCREPSLPTLITVLCDVHVEKSQVSDARDLITQIKKQSTSDRCAAQIDSKHVLEQKEPVFTDVINCQGNLTTALCDNAKDLSKSVVDFTDKENGAPVDDDKPVFYMYSDRYLELCDAMVRVPGRACMVHRLIESYGLLRYVRLVPPCKLRREDLLQFHSEDYLGVLERLNSQGEDGYDEQSQLCGIGYDCPVLPGVLDCASLVAAATVTAANCLVHGKCSVAINWFGGWHHAKKDEASGFCYINDIVLGILRLREKYQRVLYIDLDLHHGDGVEDAFAATSNVFTLSFHKYSSGFFPGTGPMSEVGVGKGRYFSLNVPLLDGIRDDHFHGIVSRLTEKVREVYSPQAVICQCGADGLAGDPMDSFNLSHLGLGRVIHSLLQWKIPLLLLGGGGYNHANTARAWTFLTSVAVRKKLPPDIPDHRFFTTYGPSYELAVTTGNRKDLNTRDYLTRVFRQALGILQKTSQMLKRTEDVKS